MGEAIRERGITWSRGRVFHRDREIYAFDLTEEPDARMPAFVNLQQYLVEEMLHARYRALGGELRATHAMSGLSPREDGVLVEVATPAGSYRVHAQWLVSCEGVRSVARRTLGLSFRGELFDDRFLIADVRMRGEFPTERWFWFEPPFHPGQTALLHRQADDIWRIDLQLGPDADPEVERRPERVRPRIAAMLGHDSFDLVWVSVYAFQCRSLERYVHGRVIFAGDSAHQVSPFGARGGNGGVQDADNLAWKLARVLRGESPASLIESYDLERREAAEENIAHSTRATDFMVPRSRASRVVRDTILAEAASNPVARRLINAGRLSTPCLYRGSPLSVPDTAPWPAEAPAPGGPAIDQPLAAPGTGCTHLLQQLGGDFVLMACPDTLASSGAPAAGLRTLALEPGNPQAEAVAASYGLGRGRAILFRPDQHVAARLADASPGAVRAALRQAGGLVSEMEGRIVPCVRAALRQAGGLVA